MAKIALELERAVARRAVNGAPGHTTGRVLAHGHGWSVADVVCTSGPHDRPFEEQHADVCIAIVAAGSFQYRASVGRAGAGPTRRHSGPDRELMTPGSLLLGNAGQCFECGHEHGAGDRCVAFAYAPAYFERLAADAGFRGPKADFRLQRVPPVRALSPLVARVCAGLSGSAEVAWEELSIALAAQTVQFLGDRLPARAGAPAGALARVTRIVRTIERQPAAGLTVASLAREVELSPYHFLRTFQRVTGVTPHQYVLRTRLREAALRLAGEPASVLDIALDSGFGDVSNFNHAFRGEFGMSPRAYRRQMARKGDRR